MHKKVEQGKFVKSVHKTKAIPRRKHDTVWSVN